MKTNLIFIFLFNIAIAYGQNLGQGRSDSIIVVKTDSQQKFIPVKFSGVLYGFITGSYVDYRGEYLPTNGTTVTKIFKSSKTVYKIKLFQPLTDQQTNLLEDSIKQATYKIRPDTYVSFDYTKDYYTRANQRLTNIQNSQNIDSASAGYYLIKSGRIRNDILTFAIVSSITTGGIILFLSPIAGEIIAAVCGIIIIAEEYRANNMLIKAGHKMLLE